MPSIQALAEHWASLYSNSAVLRSLVNFAHIGALVTGGGYAVAADVGLLRARRRGEQTMQAELERRSGVHGWVVASLVVVAVSGVLLVLADLEAFFASRAFWLKMILVGALVANGLVLMQAGAAAARGDARARSRLALASGASIALWLATILMGAVLPNAL